LHVPALPGLVVASTAAVSLVVSCDDVSSIDEGLDRRTSAAEGWRQ
jgi:hypothetical protein